MFFGLGQIRQTVTPGDMIKAFIPDVPFVSISVHSWFQLHRDSFDQKPDPPWFPPRLLPKPVFPLPVVEFRLLFWVRFINALF